MKAWHVTWLCFAVVLVGAFLPWARIDLEEAAANAQGNAGLAAFLLSKFTPTVEATAWNGRVPLGTAAIPAWVVLVADFLAACASMLRARGVRAIARGVSPLLAAAALALAGLFGMHAL